MKKAWAIWSMVLAMLTTTLVGCGAAGGGSHAFGKSVSFTSNQGFEYSLSRSKGATAPEIVSTVQDSPRDWVAAPGKSFVVIDVKRHNLVSDRPAPSSDEMWFAIALPEARFSTLGYINNAQCQNHDGLAGSNPGDPGFKAMNPLSLGKNELSSATRIPQSLCTLGAEQAIGPEGIALGGWIDGDTQSNTSDPRIAQAQLEATASRTTPGLSPSPTP